MNQNTLGGALSRRGFMAAACTAVGASGLAKGESPEADRWQIGCYTRPWDKYEYPYALDAIAEAGYQYAGLMTTKSESGLIVSANTPEAEARKAGEACKERGLEVLSIYGGDLPVAETAEACVEAMRRLVNNCIAAGSSGLLMGGVQDPAHYEPYYHAIGACCDMAREHGLHITVKPHGGSNATGPQCRKSIEAVGHENFRLWYDPANIYYYSDGAIDPVDDAATVDGLVTGMSVKDYQHPKEVLITPGTGMVDMPRVMERLAAGGFTSGPLVVECLKPGTLPELVAEARKARLFTGNLIQA